MLVDARWTSKLGYAQTALTEHGTVPVPSKQVTTLGGVKMKYSFPNPVGSPWALTKLLSSLTSWLSRRQCAGDGKRGNPWVVQPAPSGGYASLSSSSPPKACW